MQRKSIDFHIAGYLIPIDVPAVFHPKLAKIRTDFDLKNNCIFQFAGGRVF